MSAIPAGLIPEPEKMVPVLVVSSHQEDHASIQKILAYSNWQPDAAYDGVQALDRLRNRHIPVAICASDLPDGGWESLCEEMADVPAAPRFFVFSHQPDQRLWVEVINLGGYDVLSFPFLADEVYRSVYLAWASWKQELRWRAKRPKGSAVISFPPPKQ